MEKTIKIYKFTTDGKPLKNEAGDFVYTEFYYNFEQLGMSRKLMGIKFFELSEKQIENPPNNDYELSVIMVKQFEQRAYEAILMRKVNDEFELYNPNKTTITEFELNELGKGENWDTIQEIKKDFFTKAHVKSSNGIKELMSLIMPLMQLQTALKDENGNAPSTLELLDAVQQITTT